MASPLSIFRKYQYVALVALGVVAIISFVILPPSMIICTATKLPVARNRRKLRSHGPVASCAKPNCIACRIRIFSR